MRLSWVCTGRKYCAVQDCENGYRTVVYYTFLNIHLGELHIFTVEHLVDCQVHFRSYRGKEINLEADLYGAQDNLSSNEVLQTVVSRRVGRRRLQTALVVE